MRLLERKLNQLEKYKMYPGKSFEQFKIVGEIGMNV